MTDIITLLAVDVGNKRVGLAVANTVARLPRALTTLERNGAFWTRLKEITEAEGVQQIVVGLPRGLNGQETEQTTSTRQFADILKQNTGIPVAFQDEALTSWQAERELEGSRKSYNKGQIDALAAVYILEDYLHNYGTVVSNG